MLPGYKIERELGRGGMAEVYLAFEEKLERWVALKILLPSLAQVPNATRRFLKEARTAARLTHSHIITVHAVNRYRGIFYMAMEYLDGGSLKGRIAAGTGLKAQPPPGTGWYDHGAALEIVEKIAGALDYAHRQGIVHRDIKPDNIMFRGEGDGTPVLTDFGIAKAADWSTRLTATGMSIGTPHYMSPEQLRGKKVDGRADIYGLGVVLFEMLTGRVPFDAEDIMAVAAMQVKEPVPRLPKPLARFQPLIDRMMAKNPHERFGNGGELVRAIGEIQPAPGDDGSHRGPAFTREKTARSSGDTSAHGPPREFYRRLLIFLLAVLLLVLIGLVITLLEH